MLRYLVAVWNPHSVDSVRTLEALNLARNKPAHWLIAHESPGLMAMYSPRHLGAASLHVLKPRGGLILGRVFERHRSGEASFDSNAAAQIVRSGGQALIDNYWGSYLAVLCDETSGTQHVLGDPVGTLPCYHLRYAGVDLFFSHIAECVSLLPASFEINRRHLASWLLYNSVPTDEVGLREFSRLPRGERLTFSPTGMSRKRLWDPAAIASAPRLLSQVDAARELRSSVQDAVNAWSSGYRNITHRLSGGLDSAIIAGCLAHAPSGPVINYLNMSLATDIDGQRISVHGVDAKTAAKLRSIAGHGDERHYARLVAKRWSVPMIERQRDPLMDLRRLEASPLTLGPSMYFTMVEMDDAELELIETHHSQVFFSGQAGDSALLATMQPLPAMDHAYMHGLKGDLWQQIVASSALSKESLWSVVRKTLEHGLLRRPYQGPMRLRDRPTMLSQNTRQSLKQEDLDSTLDSLVAHSSLPPGKRSHVKGIASRFHEYVFHSGEAADHVDPLNSQPVWEVLLQIPTYTLLANGVSRGLARQAFGNLLPEEIRKRQAKGTGTYYYQKLIKHNRRLMLDRLADGLLVSQDYLDRSRLVECLTQDDPSVTIPAPTLVGYFAAELWLQQWHDVLNERRTRPQSARVAL